MSFLIAATTLGLGTSSCGANVVVQDGGEGPGDGGAGLGAGGSIVGDGVAGGIPDPTGGAPASPLCDPEGAGAALFACTHVASMVTDQPGYESWIGAWFDVTAEQQGSRFGALLPFDEPNTPEVEEQYYYDELMSPELSVLSVGPSNGGPIPAQVLRVTTDACTLDVYMPALVPDDCVRTRLYVAVDGSTYHSRADHDYSFSPDRINVFDGKVCTDFGGAVGPDLTPEQAFVPEHLARAAGTPN